MKVLVLASLPESLVNFRLPLLKSMQALGYEVHVAAPGIDKADDVLRVLSPLNIVSHDIHLKRAGLNPFSDVLGFFDIFSVLRRVRPDIFFAYTVKPVIYGNLAAWFSGVPKIVSLITGLGYAFQEDKKFGLRRFVNQLVRRLYKFSLCHSDLVFFQNPDDQALFKFMDIMTSRVRSVVVNGSGVDIHQYSLSPIPAGRTGSSTTFLLIARLLGDKGVREYVQAARRMKARYPETVFRLVGWLDENPDAIHEQELQGWVAEGVVEYPGRLSDVRPAIADCTVYVLPSYREGTPRTVLEAMAMGRPIITTDAPGCRETVVDGDNGFLVPVKAVDELVAAMEKFVLFPELVGNMGNRSREIAESKYDVNAVNAVMLREMGITGKADA